MYSNYDQFVPARVAGIFFLFLLFILLTVGSKAHASCLSFLPHGYNGAFVHLPKSTQFCVETKDGRVDYHTNEFHARVIGAPTSLSPVYAFGESQLVEIFPRTKTENHILNKIYGSRRFYIHGAPNNGPNETLAYIDYIFRDHSYQTKHITVGFNLGFDFFRIIPIWRTADKVQHKSDQINLMLNYPNLYEILNFGRAIMSTRFQTIDPVGQIKNARDHFYANKTSIEKFFIEWLIRLRELKQKYALDIDIVFFESYWSYDISPELKAKKNKLVTVDLKNVICSGPKILSTFPRVLFVQYQNEGKVDQMFTYTSRHFKAQPTDIITYEQYCPES